MKKRLEAELLSIAHRVLKLKNKSEVDQLYHETQKLYEALTVLKFYDDNYEQVKSEITDEDLHEKLSEVLEAKTTVVPVAVEEPKEEVVAVAEESEVAEIEEEVTAEPEIVAETEEPEAEVAEEPIVVGEITLEDEEEEEENTTEIETPEPIAEETSDVDFGAIFEMAAERPEEIEKEVKEETPIDEVKPETKQISFQDLLGENYTEPVFVKPTDVTKPAAKKEEEKAEVIVEKEDNKPLSLNDKLSKSINIGLNDRMGFVKFLFNDSTEDYNRVLSQLNTFGTFAEARDFIEDIIKPDYNNWEGVDDYAERFIEIVEKKFE